MNEKDTFVKRQLGNIPPKENLEAILKWLNEVASTRQDREQPSDNKMLPDQHIDTEE